MSGVEIKNQNGVLSVCLNRPDVHNAMDAEMIADLTAAFAQPHSDQSIRVVRLFGNGRSFCAGADLKYMKSMAGFDLKENQADAEKLFDMFEAVRNCPVPVLARLHGSVMGGASGLAAACDHVAAEPGTKFCFSEVKLGIAPAVISPFVMEKMNPALARELMMTARLFESEEALSGGLIQFVGSREECEEQLDKVTERILAAGPEAVRVTKDLLNKVSEANSWSELKSLTTKVIAERRVSAEGQEGIGAFFEKRPPSWQKVKS
ncbi:MAG: enoyl-CoA hydratase/isomerase family protein [Bdellovibrionaceae bacterium]|nr:enoyl-CoA hydratase/isomerase family protein [Bdellovibrionales bacterium]MCB9086275.1 enoyl-CoA hydratase/isomerase family protein [Pseudobdellovibrionaceae bacterium]